MRPKDEWEGFLGDEKDQPEDKDVIYIETEDQDEEGN